MLTDKPSQIFGNTVTRSCRIHRATFDHSNFLKRFLQVLLVVTHFGIDGDIFDVATYRVESHPRKGEKNWKDMTRLYVRRVTNCSEPQDHLDLIGNFVEEATLP